MFRKFTVRNFRCFRDIEIEPLARVNLIAGRNNVGKTALLEALNIHSAPSTPERVFAANFLRGAGKQQCGPLERTRLALLRQAVRRSNPI